MSTIKTGTTLTTAYQVEGDTTGALVIQTGATPTTAVTINSSQNVGIGTSSPVRKLQVQTATTGNVDAISWSDNSTDTGYLGIASGGGARLWAGGFLALGAGGGASFTERMRIDSSGNLLVGTTSTISGSGANLQVTGAALSPVGAFNSQQIGGIFYFYYSGSLVGNISTNGSNLTLNSTSDYRRKENVQPLLRALEKVSALRPVSYKWKDTGLDGQGFIAHELQEIIPECVTGEKDAVETYIDEEGNEQTRPIYQGIDTSFLVATLTAAIQELKAELDAAKADIATLKGAA
jgi:hypothetical protein